MNELYQMLRKIQADPEGYLDGKLDLTRITAFANGFTVGKGSHGIEEPLLGDDFSLFVQNQWGGYENAFWDRNLKRLSGTPRGSFYQFYRGLDIFYGRENPKVVEEGAHSPLKHEDLTVETLLTILDQMREYPGTWLGDITAERMYFFIRGFMTAETMLCGKEDLDGHPFDGPPHNSFTTFVRKFYGIEEPVTWLRILQFKSPRELDELKLFYTVLDEYRKQLS